VYLSGESKAVFLSYASEDAEAAQNIADSLRAAGIEVWFDQRELKGGDAWDQSIRRQIKTCALFVAVVSKHTHERGEGYFRLEWKLAVDRSHLIAAHKAFLLPIVIDDTGEDDEHVPDRFREVQWTRLPGGETPPAFVDRVQRLLSGEASTVKRAAAVASEHTPARSRRLLSAAIAVVILGATAYFTVNNLWIAKPPSPAPAATPTSAAPAAFNPPPHSIAVLPFVNLSGDKDQEYFSDGLTEEILNSLAQINDLQVAARPSSFSFREHPDIVTVGHKLNVAAVLEGSVRRSDHTVRVTAQLINAVTGYHLWSKSYDRNLADVLRLQTEIATAVAAALKVTMLGDIAEKIELGGTRNPAAFDAYLRASKAFFSRRDAKDIAGAIAAYSEAIRLDPSYALAFAYRSFALTTYAAEADVREDFEKAEADARRALALAPELAEAHAALGYVLGNTLDFAGAKKAYDRALAIAPGNTQVLLSSAEFGAWVGLGDTAIAAARRAVVLDPLDRRSHSILGRALYFARRYAEAATAHAEATRVNPDYAGAYAERGLALYALGNREGARASCEAKRDYDPSRVCLAVVYEKLGRRADAVAEFAKLKAAQGDASAYDYATIYSQWGDRTKALDWLDTAVRLHDSSLESLKTDPLMDPLRGEPRFEAIERALKFPE